MKLLKVEVNTFGGSPFAEHNYPCPVCREKHAVLDLSTGLMQPCWGCQEHGYVLKRLSRLAKWWRDRE